MNTSKLREPSFGFFDVFEMRLATVCVCVKTSNAKMTNLGVTYLINQGFKGLDIQSKWYFQTITVSLQKV